MLLPQFDTFSIVTLWDPYSPLLDFPHHCCSSLINLQGKKARKNIYPAAYVQEKENREEKPRRKKKESRLCHWGFFGENFVATFCCRLCSIAQEQLYKEDPGSGLF